MDIGLFSIYAVLFVLGMWYAFRSGQMHERAKWEDDAREGSDY